MMVQLAASVYRDRGGRDQRRAVSLDSTVRNERREPIDATVLDVSTSGFRERLAAALDQGEEITLGMPGLGMIPAVVVRKAGHDYGCEFRAPVPVQALASALEANPVLEGRFPLLPSMPEPVVERWPAAVRLSIIAGSTAVLWGMLIAGGYALFR